MKHSWSTSQIIETLSMKWKSMHGEQISEKVSGWIRLRRSQLSSEQKQLIQSQCPELSYDKVVEAMFFLLGPD